MLLETGAELYTLPLPTLWTMFFGIVNPWIIGFIIRSSWSKRFKSTAAFGMVLLSSMIGELIEGRLFPVDTNTWRGWASSVFYITILTYSMYTALYKPWTDKQENVEAIDNKIVKVTVDEPKIES